MFSNQTGGVKSWLFCSSCQDKIRHEKHDNNSHQTVIITPICVGMQAATGPGGLQSVELLHFKGLNNVQREDSVKNAIKKNIFT